jgi:hypothetical protein
LLQLLNRLVEPRRLGFGRSGAGLVEDRASFRAADRDQGVERFFPNEGSLIFSESAMALASNDFGDQQQRRDGNRE